MGENPHPTQKPEELLRKFVLASSNKGDLVIDPLQLDRFYRINGLRKKTFNTYPVHPVKITPCGKVQTVVWRKFSKVETVNRQLGLSCCKARSTPSGSWAITVR